MPPRDLFFYEAPEDGGGETAEAPEPEVDQGTGDQAGAEEQAAWQLSQDDWQATMNYLQATAPVIQQVAALMQQQEQAQYQQQPQEPQQPLPEWDPWDPASVQQYINAAVEQGVLQATGPYQQLFNTMAESEGERLAQQTLGRLQEEVGSFDADATYMIAAGALADESLNPDHVLTSAARYMHDFEQKIRSDEREKYKAELTGISQNPSDSPVGASAGREDETIPTGPRRYHEAVERALSRRNPGFPVG